MEARTLFNGALGVKAHVRGLESVSDNIANVSTYGYKATRTEFADLLYQEMAGGAGFPQQVGNGSLASVENLMVQAPLEPTDNVLDMAINGRGFFTVKHPDRNEGNRYTRAGQFYLDKDYFLVNSEGYRVQGFAVDADGNVNANQIGDIQIDNQLEAAVATTSVDLAVNLDASDTTEFRQAVAIDPTDNSTYNFRMGFQVVDADGDKQDIAVLYQKLESYTGDAPTGSQSVWKAATFYNDNGTLSADPSYPDNTFFLHFDTEGNLVGVTTGTPATGDAYTSGAEVTSTSSPVSDRLGETFSFTADGGTQTLRSTASITFSGTTTAGDTVTIGGTTYTFAALSPSDAAAWLADQINANSAGSYYAHDNGSGTVTLYAKDGAAAAEVSASSVVITTDDTMSLTELVNTIDNGREATGSLFVNIAGLTAGSSTVTVAGHTFTYGAAQDFTTLSELTTLINDLSEVDATSSGHNIYITAASTGTSGNSLGLTTNDAANVVVSSSSLQNGLDDGDTTHVDASATTGSGGGQALKLERTDVGASATIDVANTNTLGSNLGLDFTGDNFTQTSSASDGNGTSNTTGEVPLTFSFTKNGTTSTQEVTLDFSPDDGDDTTMLAGDYETFYLKTDGRGTGYLKYLEIDDQGLITAHYTNGQGVPQAALALTTFIAPQELLREGDNLWRATAAAGNPTVAQGGDAQSDMGKVKSYALELSTVDLAQEFVNLINYQRSFQANSKSIITGDEMLKTAINLKG